MLFAYFILYLHAVCFGMCSYDTKSVKQILRKQNKIINYNLITNENKIVQFVL